MDFQQIQERLAVVLRNAEGWLPSEQLADMQMLVRVGEPGVALENFWTQLDEYDVAVPEHVIRELKDLAAAMGMTPPVWFGSGKTA